MNTTIPYTNLITGTMDVISQSLTIPVLIILSIMFIITVVMLGMVISEYTSRKKVSVETISNLIYDINNATSINELDAIVSNCQLPQSQKDVLNKIIGSNSLTETSREALARRLVETEEEKTEIPFKKQTS